ncbi:CopD family protein [Legionella clemsonensis]|uniref:Uncharacterized protein n=1 Tax=Legionella clemsonensis TaxID=1867846 RepID=A0A222NZZ9_9GAMM|nr:CopD family protein [Legionella clemsonensis]ASQ45177.1 hypothetical protein clem_03095 [Legionella clemsonensis]
MNWLLLLHISAILCWCGTLLYLLAFITDASLGKHEVVLPNINLPHFLFTLVLTPAALIAIISGTLLFITMKIIALWLIVKLTLVAGLVICHALAGWMVLKIGTVSPEKMKLFGILCGNISILLIIAIFWIVLAKPPIGKLL